jgi:catechol 2,3-dioxygenase-like lactoylglutathione lyase family enzyme
MKIRGVDQVVLGVEDMEAAQRFLRDFGLSERERGAQGATFEALDGTNLLLRGADDRALPMAVGSRTNAREIIWGVDSAEELQKLGAELSKDRQVAMGADGVLRTHDHTGYAISFQVTKRHAYDAQPALINVAGRAPQRAPNQRVDFSAPHRPRSIGHIVLYVPDLASARDFYIQRLGFRLTDSYRDRSCFLRAQGSHDHHTLFLIQKEDIPGGLHHIEFHVGDFNEVMLGGRRLTEKGWKTYVGPGRHVLGSNYFWYFKTPCGGAMELACDMDYADDDWEAKEWEYSTDVIAAWCTSYTLYGH